MPPDLIQRLLLLQMMGPDQARELDYGLRDLPAGIPMTPPEPTLPTGPSPPQRTLEDVYRESLQGGGQGGSILPGGVGFRSTGELGAPQVPEGPPYGPMGSFGGIPRGFGPIRPGAPSPAPAPLGDIGMDPTGTYDWRGEKIGLAAQDYIPPPSMQERVHGQGWTPAGAVGQALLELPQTAAARLSGTGPAEPTGEYRLPQMGASPNLGLPVSPPAEERLSRLAEARGVETMPPVAEGQYALPDESARLEKAREFMDIARRLHGGEPPVTGAETVAEAAQDEADEEAPPTQTRLPIVEKPGDLRRAALEKKLAMLTAFRDIAEGLGRPVRVKGEITQGVPPPQPYRAEGIREAMGLVGQDLADLSAEDKLRLAEQLRGERETGLEKLRQTGAMERLERQEEIRGREAETAHRRMLERQSKIETQRQQGRRELLNQRLSAVGKKPLTDAAIGRLTAMDHMERDLIDVLRNKHKYNTGPLQELFDSSLEWALGEWVVSPERKGFKAKLNNILAWYVRAVEGGRPSDKDREYLKTVAPHAGDDDGQLVTKAQNLLAWVRRNRGDVVKYLETDRTLPEGESAILSGAIPFSELSEEQQAGTWEPDFVKVQIPGQEPREIPRANLQLFIEDHPDGRVLDEE